MKPNDRKFGEKQSFPFPLWNGLLEHRKRLGSAIWEFLWCLDKITAEKDGVGLVWDGAPVKAKQIAQEFKVDPESVKRNLRKLSDKGYLRLRRTPHGYSISVMNSLKFGIWAAHKRSDRNVVSLPERDDKNVASEPGEATEVSLREDTKVSLVESTQQSYAASSLSELSEKLVEMWNENRGCLPGIKTFDEERKTKLKARLKKNPDFLGDLKAVLPKANHSRFLTGKKTGWKANIDWFLRNSSNLTKVAEGNYDDSMDLQPTEVGQGQQREMVRARVPA